MKKVAEKALGQRVGRAIAERRKAQGITQEAMAEKLGLGLEAISRMERGTIMPSIPRLVEVAEVLKCPVQELLVVGSDRAIDHSIQLTQQLGQIKPKDRELLLNILGQLTTRLK